MKNKIKLSIIIPAYQAEKYIEDCLKSIFASSRKDFEVVLIDDGSNDNTVKICREIAEKQNKLKIFQQKNKGVSVARNNGIKHSVGDYIMFLDSDDMLLDGWSDILDNQLDADIYYINPRLEEKDKDYVMDKIVGFSHGKKVSLRNDPTYIPGPVSKLYKRKMIIDNKISFSKDIIFAEDMLFNMEALESAQTIDIIKKSIYLYRIHSKSTTRSFNAKIYKSYELFYEHIEKNGYKQQYISFLKEKMIYNIILQICMITKYRQAKMEFLQLRKMPYCRDDIKCKSIKGFKKTVLKLYNKRHYILLYLILKPALYLKFYRKNGKLEVI